MTLFEAIRQLKEGQYVNVIADVGCFCGVYAWEWGAAAPKCVLDEQSWGWIKGRHLPKIFTDTNVIICDIPKDDQPRTQTLYDVLVEGCNKKAIGIKCEDCQQGDPATCYPVCGLALIDTLQSIALAQGFDLKKVVK